MQQLRYYTFWTMLVVPLLFFSSCARDRTCLSLEVAEPGPGGRRLLHYPPHAYHPGVNPPGFTWSAPEKASSYRFLLFKDLFEERKGNLRGIDLLL